MDLLSLDKGKRILKAICTLRVIILHVSLNEQLLILG